MWVNLRQVTAGSVASVCPLPLIDETKQAGSIEIWIVPVQCLVRCSRKYHQLGVRLHAVVHAGHVIEQGMPVSRPREEDDRHIFGDVPDVLVRRDLLNPDGQKDGAQSRRPKYATQSKPWGT